MKTKTSKTATATATAPTAPAPTATPKATRPNATTLEAGGGLCWCGCGQHTIRPEARFISGHDARLKGNMQRAACGISRPGDLSIEQLRMLVEVNIGQPVPDAATAADLAEATSPGWRVWVEAAQERHEAALEAKAEAQEARAAAKAQRAADKEAEAKAEAEIKANNKAQAEKAKAKAAKAKAQAA